jgi:hypothetical protein
MLFDKTAPAPDTDDAADKGFVRIDAKTLALIHKHINSHYFWAYTYLVLQMGMHTEFYSRWHERCSCHQHGIFHEAGIFMHTLELIASQCIYCLYHQEFISQPNILINPQPKCDSDASETSANYII